MSSRPIANLTRKPNGIELQNIGFVGLILMLTLGLLVAPSSAVDPGVFQPLGDLPGGNFTSATRGVSADGQVVVGWSLSGATNDTEAYVWTQSEGMTGLGFRVPCSAPNVNSEAYGVSADGTIVAGTILTGELGGCNGEAFSWTEGGGMVGLGITGNMSWSSARDISADGNWIVGYGAHGGDMDFRTFRWNGSFEILGFNSSRPDAVNEDGTVIVGLADFGSGQEAFRWTSGAGWAGLGDLAGGAFESAATDVSSDGSVVVGWGTSGSGREAFRWVETGSMSGLGFLPGGLSVSEALAVSGDGSIVVGESSSSAGPGPCDTGLDCEAFMWDATNGMRRVADVLTDGYGVDLTDWTLTAANVISDDGLTIVGIGINPSGNQEGWVFTFPPPPLYVDTDATGGNNDGTSWADAYTNLQDALAYAGGAGGSVEKIWVAEGTYTPDQGGGQTPGDRTATFQLLDGVAIYGGFAGTEISLDQRNVSANETTLSGDLAQDDIPIACTTDSDCLTSGGKRCVDGFCIIKSFNAENSYHVVTGSGTDNTAIIDGLTVTGGMANGSSTDKNGGGIFNMSGSPSVLNCKLAANQAQQEGGGMYNNSNSSPNVASCIFAGNSAEDGAGMLNDNSSNPRVTDCSFENNAADNNGGGGMNNGSSPLVTNCTFSGNAADGGGGGVYNYLNSSPTVTNCTFSGNSANGDGGAMWNSSSSPPVTNCTFSGNTADSGGGMHNSGDSVQTITNCTFNANHADAEGGGMYIANGNTSVRNSVFWSNTDDADGSSGGPLSDESAQIHVFGGGASSVVYSIVQGGWTGSGGTGNSSSDPLFVRNPDDGGDGWGDDPGTPGVDESANDDFGDLRLQSGSPAIDAGDNDAVPADTEDLDGDLNSTEPVPYDLSGRPRFLDDPSTNDTGSGVPPIVDMGAYEYTPPVYVDADAASGGEDGSSWADAFSTLQDALTYAAGAGGAVAEIWVAEGTYMPDGGRLPVGGDHLPGSGERTATFQMLNGVGLYGGFDGTETKRSQRNPTLHPTILSGDLEADDTPVACTQDADCSSNGELCMDGFCIIDNGYAENSYHVVTGSGADSSAVMDGFTITAGNADEAGGISDPHPSGGGVYNASGSPTVRGCRIIGNRGRFGAGLHNTEGGSPTIADCTFRGNSGFQGGGGGMLNDPGSDPTVTNSLFKSNNAVTGAGMYNYGSPTVSQCTFDGNSAGGGGGMVNFTPSAAVITNCVFSENKALSNGGGMGNNGGSTNVTNCIFRKNEAGIAGGAMGGLAGDDATVTNCVFAGNLAGGTGGAIRNDDSSFTITNCTFSGNSANDLGGGLFSINGGMFTVNNSIFWENTDDADSSMGGPFMDETAQIDAGGGSVAIDHSIVQGWTGGPENIGDDPLLVDADGPDDVPGTEDDILRLNTGSPAIDAGDSTALPADAVDLDNDGDTLERIPLDLAGSPRQLDDQLTADTGVPGSPVVDMGAYEFLRDCDGNGTADVDDLADCTGDPSCSDCDANSIPDACDIAECDPDVNPACDDCNLDGIPDGCVPPATCIDAVDDGAWTSGSTWDLGGSYPDNNTGVMNQNVTLKARSVTMDIDVEIPTLRILNGASLNANGHDLTVVDPGGSVISGGTSGLRVDSGLELESNEAYNTTNLAIGDGYTYGSLIVGSSSTVSVCNPVTTVCDPATNVFTIDGGGLYSAAVANSQAQLEAGRIVLKGALDEAVPGGTMELTGSMTVATTGNFTLDGSGVDPNLPCTTVGLRVPRKTRPILPISGDSFIAVGADFIMLGSVEITLGPNASVHVAGNLINQTGSANCIDLSDGEIVVDGEGGVLRETVEQKFEVAGLDFDPSLEGFAPAGSNATNFTLGTLEVLEGRVVRFVDEFDNDGRGQSIAQEALYVHKLILRPGSTIIIDNCKVYYGALVNQGATIDVRPTGDSAEVPGDVLAPLAAPFPHDRLKNRYISFDPNKEYNDGKDVAFRVELKSINMGSCNDATGGDVDFCRTDRGAADCNSCVGGLGGTCINTPIHCSTGGGVCTPTLATCVNDAPNSGGSNVGQVWWVGPEHPSGNGVHLLVSEPFRAESTDWGTEFDPTNHPGEYVVHVGDCEIVPQASYAIRAVELASGNESDELVVETTQFPPTAPPTPFWWADAIGALQFFCNGDIRSSSCTVETQDTDCGSGIPCLRAWTLPNGSVNFDDINAALTLVAPPGVGVPAQMTWVDLHGGNGDAPPNGILNSSDLQQFIFGFGGFPFTGFDPADCPDTGAWP